MTQMTYGPCIIKHIEANRDTTPEGFAFRLDFANPQGRRITAIHFACTQCSHEDVVLCETAVFAECDTDATQFELRIAHPTLLPQCVRIEVDIQAVYENGVLAWEKHPQAESRKRRSALREATGEPPQTAQDTPVPQPQQSTSPKQPPSKPSEQSVLNATALLPLTAERHAELIQEQLLRERRAQRTPWLILSCALLLAAAFLTFTGGRRTGGTTQSTDMGSPAVPALALISAEPAAISLEPTTYAPVSTAGPTPTTAAKPVSLTETIAPSEIQSSSPFPIAAATQKPKTPMPTATAKSANPAPTTGLTATLTESMAEPTVQPTASVPTTAPPAEMPSFTQEETACLPET